MTGILHRNGQEHFRSAEYGSEVDDFVLNGEDGVQTFAIDNCIEADCGNSRLRIVGDDGQIIERGAGIHVAVDRNSSLYLDCLAGSHKTVSRL